MMVNISEAVNNGKKIKVDLNRAKSYLARHDVSKAVDTVLEYLTTRAEQPVLGVDKVDIDLLLGDFCAAFNKNSQVLEFLAKVGYTKKQYLSFKSGGEQNIVNRLAMYQLAHQQLEEDARQAQHQEHARKREALITQGREHFLAKEAPKARVCLKRAAEQYGREPGLLARIGELFIEFKEYAEGAEILRRAIEAFPQDQTPYKPLVEAYLATSKMPEAEALYLEAIKLFGGHPVTYMNLANLYKSWRRYRDAADYAQRALDMDPSLTEAKQIIDRYG